MSIYKYMLDAVIGLDENKNYQFILTDNDGFYVGRKEGVTGTATGYNINPNSDDWNSSGDDFDLVLDWAGSSVEIVNEQSDEVKVGTIACYVEYDAAWRFLGYAYFEKGSRYLGPDEAIEFSDIKINLTQQFEPPAISRSVDVTVNNQSGSEDSVTFKVELQKLDENGDIVVVDSFSYDTLVSSSSRDITLLAPSDENYRLYCFAEADNSTSDDEDSGLFFLLSSDTNYSDIDISVSSDGIVTVNVPDDE